MIKKLLVSSKDCEAGYVIRSLQGKLRIGLAQQTVTMSLAHAIVLSGDAAKSKKGAELADALGRRSTLSNKFSECPTFDQIVPALLEVGIEGLQERCKFTPGVPVKPMLAKPTTGVSEVLKRSKTSLTWRVQVRRRARADSSRGEREGFNLFEKSRGQHRQVSGHRERFEKYLLPSVKSAVIDCGRWRSIANKIKSYLFRF